MFGFFIVLFGIAYFSYRLISEKVEDDAYNEIKNKVDVVSDFYFKKMKDIDLESEWTNKISSGIYVNQIFEKCEEDLKFIFGDKWENEIHIPRSSTLFLKKKYFFRHEKLILRLILSKMGKFPRFEYHSGYLINSGNEWEIKMSQRIEKNLNDAGLPVEFVFKAYPPGSNVGYIAFRHNQTTNYPKLW